MSDNPNDTLTTIEAKVLCMRYGINDIDEHNSLKQLRKLQTENASSGQSISTVAETLGTDKKTMKATEINALRKLKIPV